MPTIYGSWAADTDDDTDAISGMASATEDPSSEESEDELADNPVDFDIIWDTMQGELQAMDDMEAESEEHEKKKKKMGWVPAGHSSPPTVTKPPSQRLVLESSRPKG